MLSRIHHRFISDGQMNSRKAITPLSFCPLRDFDKGNLCGEPRDVVCCSVTRSYPTLYDPMDCSPPGPSVHGISQARILEWVDLSLSRDPPNPGIEPGSPALQAASLPLSHRGSPPRNVSLLLCVHCSVFWNKPARYPPFLEPMLPVALA